MSLHFNIKANISVIVLSSALSQSNHSNQCLGRYGTCVLPNNQHRNLI